MQERRQTPRGKTLLGGWIAFNNRCSTVDCVVRNLSPNGAKIVFESTGLIASEIDLTIRTKGESRRARIVWRDATQAGLVFIDHRASGLSLSAAQQITALQKERELLAQRVAQMTEGF